MLFGANPAFPGGSKGRCTFNKTNVKSVLHGKEGNGKAAQNAKPNREGAIRWNNEQGGKKKETQAASPL